MSFWKNILHGLGIGVAAQASAQHPTDDNAANLADAVIHAREAAYSQYFGTLPDDILKMANLLGRWPGGGIYKIHAEKSEGKPWIYISSGLSNPDIPITHNDAKVEHDSAGRVSRVEATLTGSGETLPQNGYGYEIMVISEEEADWPLALLQWAINGEFHHAINLLSRVEEYEGVTVSDVPINDTQTANLLIQKAQAPWPANLTLPNGDIPLLIITTITEDEMNWSLQNGRAALLELLLASPYGQISQLQRHSVAEP